MHVSSMHKMLSTQSAHVILFLIFLFQCLRLTAPNHKRPYLIQSSFSWSNSKPNCFCPLACVICPHSRSIGRPKSVIFLHILQAKHCLLFKSIFQGFFCIVNSLGRQKQCLFLKQKAVSCACTSGQRSCLFLEQRKDSFTAYYRRFRFPKLWIPLL